MFTPELIRLLGDKSKKIAVLTGAGISKESGVPTFRDPDGLWAKFRPEELANFEAFLNNPDLVSGWYAHRREIIHQVEPNDGHKTLVEIEERQQSFTLITQNVDNLHIRAGSKNVLELHGNIERNYCVDCRKPADLKNHTSKDKAPKCKHCEGLVRPDIVWFGEMLPTGVFEKAATAAEDADLFFSIGTSAAVYPAASLPVVAKQTGAYLVEINPNETELTPHADEVLFGKSGEILPKLMKAVLKD